MERRSAPRSSILYENESKSVVCVDLPRSIEEAQAPHHLQTTNLRRLISSPPISTPFPNPEPRNNATAHFGTASPAAQLSQLMTCAAVESALRDLELNFSRPFCLPRAVTRPDLQTSPTTSSASYFAPENSHMLHGSIKSMRQELVSTAPLFDLIIMDPPWPNRSAKRKRGGYSTCYGREDTRRLLSLIPISTQLAPGGVVAIWVTNSPNMTELLTAHNGLLKEWGLVPVAEWIWLKVTSAGEPICDVQSNWRKPWERLLIARRKGQAHSALDIVDKKVIVSVPDVHSRKPSLKRLFDEIMPPDYQALEVFARYLSAGWWSWGDEVTMHQSDEHWTKYPDVEVRSEEAIDQAD